MSVQRNFVFSTLLTLSNYIFPFIVFPYVSRVLGVNNIGICNFVDSIVGYASLLSLMGIAITGVREIAKAKGDKERLHATFTSLMILCGITTIISSIALVTVTYTVDALEPYRPLLLIGLLKLWGNFLFIDWFYKGLEDFKYITIRTIVVKLLFVACIFIFIRQADDYVTYFLLLCLMVAVNAVINCIRASRLVKIKVDTSLIKRFSKSFMTLGVYLFLCSMYTTFNVSYLGFSCGDTEVGYYTTSTKIFQILLAIYTAYSTVILPRASALLSEGKKEEFHRLISKSIDGLLLFSIPVIIIMVIFSSGIVEIIAGPEYGGAVVPMQIVIPLIFVIGYAQILVVQVLTPLSQDRTILFNSFLGAIVSIALNLLIVKAMGATGSAISWVVAETTVFISAQYFVTRSAKIRFPMKRFIVNICAYLPCAAICVILSLFSGISPVILVFIGIAIVSIYFIAIQKYYLRNSVFIYMEGLVKSRFHKLKR